MRRRTKVLRAVQPMLAVALVGLGLGACSAHVQEFTASPRHICAGERVELKWCVVGVATLTMTPPTAGAPEGKVASEGSVVICPKVPTQAVLHVTRFLGSPDEGSQKIDVRSAADTPEPLTASLADAAAAAGCDDGKVWATVHAQRFADGVKVARVSVRTGDTRTYEVRHADRVGTVAPGTSTTVFAGTPIVGDWQLTSSLQPGEACGTPTLPHNLVVDVYTQCIPEATK